MMDSTEWFEDPSSWNYVMSPPFYVSLTFTLLLPFVLSPLACGILIPKSRNIPPKKYIHFHTLLTSTLHGLVVSLLSVYLLSTEGNLGTSRIFSKSPLGFTTLQISVGYFLGDLFVCLLDPVLRSDPGTLLHHLAGLTSMAISLVHQGKLMFFIVCRLISELSTPFVNLLLFNQHMSVKSGFVFWFASLGMLVTFFVVRICTIPWYWYSLVYALLYDPLCPVIVELQWRIWILCMYGIFDILNLYWFVKMVRGAVKVFTRKSV